ncbi:MAG: hypothetical protein JRH16_13670 [Deltaproteobacteria bacterium]|nr:hypothetical protein [Deltaproteobacteria bacterium]MBW2361564.1 hypothetical protein [Deltaproteobacteria bacterium]
MQSFEYVDAPVPIDEGIVAAHREVWRRIAAAGAWWTGAERVAIAVEVRRAETCVLCRERKVALSPAAVMGEHEPNDVLSAAAVDAVHRIVTDARRLSKSWVEKLAAAGMSDAHYVELLGVVVAAFSVDEFHRGLGLPPERLPEPGGGVPSRERPAGVEPGVAWVPMLSFRAAKTSAPDLYAGMPMAPNVIAAMSLVPDAVRDLKRLSSVHYVADAEVANPLARGERLTRAQMELVAARVSALNECFY